MRIGRVILGLAAGAAGWLLTRQLKKLQNEADRQTGDDVWPPSPNSSAPASPQAMLACAYCGVHIPADDAVRHAGKTFCCSEHASLHS